MKAANANLNLLLPVLVLAEISLTMADKYLYPQEQNLEPEEKGKLYQNSFSHCATLLL